MVLQALHGLDARASCSWASACVREDGSRPGFLKALVRWVLWIVDGFPYFIPGLIGFIVALTTAGPPPRRRHGRQDVRGRSAPSAGTPITIGDSGQLLVGEPAAGPAVPGWAPPPAGARRAHRLGPGRSTRTPAGPAPPAPVVPGAPSPTTEGPQWDEARGTYIQWDPAQEAWMQWDEGFKAWTVIPGQ